MSIRSNIKKYFDNHAETKDNHEDATLRTHYYKTSKDKAFNVIETFIQNSQKYELNATSKEYGELSLNVIKGKKAFIVIAIIMTKPYQTAIDISVTTEALLPFDFGYSNKIIAKLYEQFNRELPLIKME
ncbi:cytosolic protein [Oceanobacillus sp. FSL H7-0719]|uniref:cytosolic protein n=1 Tax=Oceanobacillus sp. FSL H7-0719 TaxID=2954507 RepID=UPI003247B870